MTRILTYLERVILLVGSLALVAMMLHVTADVAFKYLLNSPVPLTMEMVTYYYMTAVAFLPLFALERRGASLVHVELVYGLLSRRIRKVVFPAALLVGAIYCACASYAAWKPAVDALRVGTYAGSVFIVSTWPTRFIPVVGFALLAVTLLIKSFVVIYRGIHDEDDRDLVESVSLEGND